MAAGHGLLDQKDAGCEGGKSEALLNGAALDRVWNRKAHAGTMIMGLAKVAAIMHLRMEVLDHFLRDFDMSAMTAVAQFGRDSSRYLPGVRTQHSLGVRRCTTARTAFCLRASGWCHHTGLVEDDAPCL